MFSRTLSPPKWPLKSTISYPRLSFFFLSLHPPSPGCRSGSWGPFNRWFVAMSFFMCLGRGFLSAPPGRPWAQPVGPGRFTTGNPIQPTPAGELPGHRSGDRVTEATRHPAGNEAPEWRQSDGKAPRGIYYLGSYTTDPGHLGPRGAGSFPSVAGLRNIYY